MPKRKPPFSPDSLLHEIMPRNSQRRDVTELHVHLGGSVPIYRLWEMGIERGIRGVGSSFHDFIGMLHRGTENTGDLDSYLEIFDMVELIQAGPQAVQQAIRIAINGAYRTGGMRQLGPSGEGGDPYPVFAITRLELRFNPMKRTGHLMSKSGEQGLFDVDRVILAACEAAEESELAYRGEIQTGLIFCFGRDLPWVVNKSLAEKVRHWKTISNKVIGIDLAGPESTMSLADASDLHLMAELYQHAGADLGRTVHVGETPYVSIDTFLETIRALKPHRVGHPIVAARAYWENKDARGLEILAENKITCELCVHSNLLTNAVTSVEEYGRLLRTYDEFSIPYTFSTDSPALQLTTLASELEYLLHHKAATPEQIDRALQNADAATFIRRNNNEEHV